MRLAAALLDATLWHALFAGMALSLVTIMALGPQNVHLIRMGLMRQQVGLTALTCTFGDVVLIGFSVFGLSHFGGMNDKIMGAMLGAGALFLFAYGAQAGMRFFKGIRPVQGVLHVPDSRLASALSAAELPKMSRQRAVVMALGFSLLNPHAWIDTTVIIGSASLAYGEAGGRVFGLGAILGSAIWFTALGVAVATLGKRIQSARVWHWLDGAVAVMMWGTAILLVRGLF
jgi:L-lysine exporter family protein LysE/ArgO